MAIPPDNKDWTWVLTRPCPECGFEAANSTPATAASMIPELLPRWLAVLRRPDAAEPVSDSRWSPLEYGCHVRDVFALFDQRLNLMLETDNPEFANWDQDQAAVDQGYALQDPAVVSVELLECGSELAASFASVTESQWDRTGLRSNGFVFTVRTISGYFLHDIVHHLHDVDG
ncbi:DinB family protein [Paenarthrobacter sp. Z7-10]|uniref:DinB family protein n=1 Tax=Paenarthrobacter sp. Z7-10 TaxID=2787635 RepID=UPI0022A9F66B|nr:DinB family protein [Paenarthrobacter sp. Z7-10]MCZ2403771.1 DinB family protein [Paenarthrobacter sp. Z7-10]